MNEEIKEIKFIEYNGIEGYIELMKHDVEPLNDPKCKSIGLYYDGKDIKAVLDYIAKLQQELQKANDTIKELRDNKALDLVKISINSQYINTQNENIRLQQENEKLKAYIKYLEEYNPKYYKGEKYYGIDYKSRCEKANELLKRHNEDTGNIYYKYNNRFLKSELKERLSEVLNGE